MHIAFIDPGPRRGASPPPPLAAALARNNVHASLHRAGWQECFIDGVHCLGADLDTLRTVAARADAIVVLGGHRMMHELLRGEEIGYARIVLHQGTGAAEAVRTLAGHARDVLLCRSERERRTLATRHGLDPARIRVVPSPLPGAFEAVFPATAAILSHKMWPAIVTLAETADVAAVLPLFADLRSRCPGVVLNVVAPPEAITAPIVGVNALGPLSVVERMRALRGSALLLHPGTEEGGTEEGGTEEGGAEDGLPEALAAGCLVVTGSPFADDDETMAGFVHRAAPASMAETCASLLATFDQNQKGLEDVLRRQVALVLERHGGRACASAFISMLRDLSPHLSHPAGTRSDVAARRSSAQVPTQELEQARRHLGDGRLGEAEPLLRAILAKAPDNAEALHLLGLLAHRTGHHDSAIELIAQAIGYAGETPDLLRDVAEALLAQAASRRDAGKPISAATSYRMASEALTSLGDADGARAATQAAANLSPEGAVQE
ncbi:MAG: hypothetical protein H7840_05170 [Alphaproteobacteria bacterium]